MIKFIEPHKPNKKHFNKYLDMIYKAGVFSNGGLISSRFAGEISRVLGEYFIPHMTSSGTMGLVVALLALKKHHNLHDGAYVVVSNYTFPATYQAIKLAGMTPILCDLLPRTFDIKLPQDFTVDMILETATFGQEPAYEYLKTFNVPIIIDACGAFGCLDNMGLGNNADAWVYSFHATKIVNAGEGGCVYFSNPEVDNLAARIMNFGFNEYKACLPQLVGLNAKMSEINAAMGLAS